MIKSYHQFKFIEAKTPGKTKHGLVLLNVKQEPTQYIYECKACDSRLVLKEKIKSDSVNREIFRLYPHFKCISPDTKEL